MVLSQVEKFFEVKPVTKEIKVFNHFETHQQCRALSCHITNLCWHLGSNKIDLHCHLKEVIKVGSLMAQCSERIFLHETIIINSTDYLLGKAQLHVLYSWYCHAYITSVCCGDGQQNCMGQRMILRFLPTSLLLKFGQICILVSLTYY